ncbi:MAG TPA: glucosaminidase domain-containing protein [Gaiellaceae bacterium]|nr:glucosaminidase domain-containing protein [Gaiellaceae bacterium]
MRKRVLLTTFVAALLLAPAAAAGTPILGLAAVPPEQAALWARLNGATRTFVSLAPLYWRVAEEVGVRPEVAYAQAAKETNFGRFTGVLNASFHNPCGLKRTAGGSNRSPAAHMRFRTWRQGVTAHVDHLALYAGAPGYPRAGSPDPRAFARLFGSARTVQKLGGKWAPSRGYGTSLAHFVRTLLELRRVS